VLEAAGYTVERRAILLPAPIRNVGTHTFTVRVHTEVSIEMSIRVLAEFDPNAAPPEAEVAATTEAGEEAIEETEVTAEEESAEAEEAS
ncbi:MAG: 50S ribosomal L9 C-terminal domain-containing protein, partial [bacterium]